MRLYSPGAVAFASDPPVSPPFKGTVPRQGITVPQANTNRDIADLERRTPICGVRPSLYSQGLWLGYAVGQALTADAFQRPTGSHFIVHAKCDAGVIAKIKFRQVPMQMLFAAMLVHAFHAALKD